MGERILDISDLPEDAQGELLDFYEFLKQKRGKDTVKTNGEIAMAGVLSQYADTERVPEEKSAWSSRVRDEK